MNYDLDVVVKAMLLGCSKPMLKRFAASHGLKVIGTKLDLVERIYAERTSFLETLSLMKGKDIEISLTVRMK